MAGTGCCVSLEVGLDERVEAVGSCLVHAVHRALLSSNVMSLVATMKFEYD